VRELDAGGTGKKKLIGKNKAANFGQVLKRSSGDPQREGEESGRDHRMGAKNS